jgi:hypothetical protein
LTKTHANHLSEKYLISLNHCAQLAVSTRVGGYMRGGGLERQKGKMAASSLKVVHGPVAVSPKGGTPGMFRGHRRRCSVAVHGTFMS